ncbi:uncharacterized protein LOC144658102 isoform X2 [Oculina patagonica]
MINFAMFRSKKKKPVDADPVVNQGQQLILSEELKVTRELGEGQYGVVQLGLWKPQNGANEKFVAIKSIKNTAFDGVLKSVLEEARTMQKLAHTNIVKMYGITLPFGDEPLKLVTEFASYGSLEDNLKNRESDVCRLSSLSKFAVQVAEGMNYLASKNLVHRDLSTRNILVFEPDLVKISDFGLARTLEGGAAKEITVHRRLAVAWLPPEAIRDNMFTLYSDVWSYGITLWEMFSFGEQPWANLSLTQIKVMISNEPTKHLNKPEACPDGFYEIMQGCWEPDPANRPTFEYISNRVSQLQPKVGITKVRHDTGVQGHLSYNCGVKVTVISKEGDGMLLVQSENGPIGLVHEKNLDFSKKALQKRASGNLSEHISRPYDIRKHDPSKLMPDINKVATIPISTKANKPVAEDVLVRKPLTPTDESGVVRDLLDFGDDTTDDPTNPLNPKRYAGNPATDPQQIPQGATENQAYERLVARGPTGNLGNEQLVPQGATGHQANIQLAPQRTTGNQANEQLETQGDTGNQVIAQNAAYMSMGYGPAVGAEDQDMSLEYMSMDHQHRDAAANDGDYATLKNMVGPGPDHQRLPRTQSESDVAGLETEPEYAVPYQHRKDSKDDSSLGLGSKGTPGSNKPLSDVPSKKYPPDIPERLDLQENKLIATGGGGSSATTPRKRKPIPTPRKPRPYSAESLDRKTDSGKELPPGNGAFQTRSNSESIPNLGSQSVAGASTDKKDSPPIPLPYQPAKRVLELSKSAPVKSRMHPEERNRDNNQPLVEVPDQTSRADLTSELPRNNKHYIIVKSPIPNGKRKVFAFQDPNGQEITSEFQAPLPPVEQQQGVTNNSDSSQLIEDRLYENADEVKRLSVDLIDLSVNPEEGEAISEPIYDKPINLPEPPYIPPDVLNQPPPLPEKLFGGTLGRDLDTSYQPPVGAVGGWAPRPVDPVSANPAFQPVNPVSQPVDPAPQPVDPAIQDVNPGGAASEGAYGEEIDAGIREIRKICGEEVPRDWCYAALLQYQGDIEQVVHIIKAQRLSKITGKSEPFCERTLKHCNWDMDRAAVYIFENFEDKDV